MKASNVLVSSSGQAKLVDFGLAGIDPNLSDEALAGLDNPRTIDYVALERASNVRKDDSRSDIYFIGAVYYHMLAGAPPLLETRDRLQRLSPGRFFDVVPLRQRCGELPGALTAIVDKAMELDPRLRYQAPGEMLADLTQLERRLSDNEDTELASLTSTNSGSAQHIVMLVESSARLQDTLRTKLKSRGYRVLVTGDPQRPSEWFSAGMNPADCVLFSTGNLGEVALEAFNRFGENPDTANVPAVLLLGAKHQDLVAAARLTPQRLIVTSPFKVQELLDLVERIIKAAKPEAPVEGSSPVER
jgi:serine/threonine-protein kinase